MQEENDDKFGKVPKMASGRGWVRGYVRAQRCAMGAVILPRPR